MLKNWLNLWENLISTIALGTKTCLQIQFSSHVVILLEGYSSTLISLQQYFQLGMSIVYPSFNSGT